MYKYLPPLIFTPLLLQAAEIQYGKGIFGMKGGFLGLSSRIESDISTFAFKNEHSSAGNLYYGYDITWLDSDQLRQKQKQYNSLAGILTNKASDYLWKKTKQKAIVLPEMKYRVKGLDANLRLGYDIIHQDDYNYLGVGLLLGVSAPIVDADKGDSVTPDLGNLYNEAGYILKAQKMFAKSKTKFLTYKLGPTISFQKSILANRFSIYGTASYALQNAKIKNTYAHLNSKTNGSYQSYDIGLKFTPFPNSSKDTFLFNSNLHITAGYRYNKWKSKNAIFDISGNQIDSKLLSPFKKKFEMDSSTTYAGLSYSF